MMAGGGEEPLAEPAEQGQPVGGAGAEAGPDVRGRAGGEAAQQPGPDPGQPRLPGLGGPRVEAGALLGGADQGEAAPLGDRVSPASRVDDEAGGRVDAAEREDLAANRLDRQPRRSERGAHGAAPRAGAEHHRAGGDLAPVGEPDAPGGQAAGHLDAGDDLGAPGCGGGGEQRLHGADAVDMALAPVEHRPGAGAERGLEVGDLVGVEPLARGALTDPRRLRSIQGDPQQAAGVELAVHPGHVEELGGELRPEPQAPATEVEERARLGRLAARREHPGGGAGGPGRRRPALEDHHPGAAPSAAPCDRRPGDPGAHDGDVPARHGAEGSEVLRARRWGRPAG